LLLFLDLVVEKMFDLEVANAACLLLFLVVLTGLFVLSKTLFNVVFLSLFLEYKILVPFYDVSHLAHYLLDSGLAIFDVCYSLLLQVQLCLHFQFNELRLLLFLSLRLLLALFLFNLVLLNDQEDGLFLLFSFQIKRLLLSIHLLLQLSPPFVLNIPVSLLLFLFLLNSFP
jgi:hypothetical protein